MKKQSKIQELESELLKNYANQTEINKTLDKLMQVPSAQKCYREVFPGGVGDFNPYETSKVLQLIRELAVSLGKKHADSMASPISRNTTRQAS